MTWWLRLERFAYELALLCLLVAAGRIGWTLTRTTANNSASTISVRTSPRVTTGSASEDLSRALSLQMQTPEAINSAISAAVGTAKPSGSLMDQTTSPRHDSANGYLSVQVGPPRSELRVNGRLVGKTPYVGQITCDRGQTVKLDILPPQGMPKHYEIPCLAGEMRLDDEP